MKCILQAFNANYVLGRVEDVAVEPEVTITIAPRKIIKVTTHKVEDVFVFYYVFDEASFKNKFTYVEINVSAESEVQKTSKTLPTPNKEVDKQPLSPFPQDVTKILVSLRPEFYSKNFSKEIVSKAIEDIVDIAYNGLSRVARPVHNYLLFLKSMKLKFDAIYEFFPKANLKSRNPDAIDSFNVLTMPLEMLSIANYLYVLKSYNIGGNFAEFGCFKGFSSACLSWACFELDINLDIFDSFLGLPNSNSSFYQKGDFSTDFNEVCENIRTFGRIDRIKFYQGFFSETVKTYHQPLMTFFMDVDLAVSANDVLKVLPLIYPRGGFFSHECDPSHFVGDKVVCPPSENEVVNEIILAFNKRGVSGNFVYGNTGFFKNHKQSIMPLPVEDIMKLI